MLYHRKVHFFLIVFDYKLLIKLLKETNKCKILNKEVKMLEMNLTCPSFYNLTGSPIK